MATPDASTARVGRNTFAQLIGRGSWLAASLFLTPYLFQNLGAAVFGVWSLLAGGVTVAMLTDFGLAPALIREVAAGRAGPTSGRTRQALGLGLVAFAIFAAALLATAWGLSGALDSMLGLGLGAELQHALLLSAGAAGAMGLSVPFVATLDGHQRMDLSALATGVGAITWTGVTILGIEMGLGLVAPALGLLSHGVVRGLISAILALRQFPGDRPSLSHPTPGLFGELFGFGAKLQVANFGAIVNSEADRWLIAVIASPAIVAPYEIALKLVAFAKLVPGFVLAALFPVASQAHGAGDGEGLDRIYARTTRYLALTTAAGTAVLFAAAEPAIVSWIGEPLALGRDALWLLIPAAGINLCTGAVSLTTRAEGEPGRETRYALLAVALNVVFTIPLVIAFGALGAIAGSSIGISVASIYFIWSFHRATGRPLSPTARVLTQVWSAAAIAAGTGVLFGAWIGTPADRLEGLVALAGTSLITLSAYVMALTGLRFWNHGEIRYARSAIWPLGRGVRPRPSAPPAG